jgi:ABC-type phosphate transport system permease subunit
MLKQDKVTDELRARVRAELPEVEEIRNKELASLVVEAWSLAGIVTGSLLAIARVAGETAPLLFTALGSSYLVTNLNEPMAALPLVVFTYATGPYPDWHRLAWATALVLIVVVLILSIAARLATRQRFHGR